MPGRSGDKDIGKECLMGIWAVSLTHLIAKWYPQFTHRESRA